MSNAKAEKEQTSMEDIKAQREALQKQMDALDNQAKHIEQRAYFEIYSLLAGKGITASAMIEFLQEMVKDEGVIVKYPYKNPEGVAKTFNYKAGQKGPNPFAQAIKIGGMERADALKYAVGPEGVAYVEKLYTPAVAAAV